MPYNLGIDIGITSLGFAGVGFKPNLEPNGILFAGSHIFEAAEDPKTGSSLAEPRRNARGARRIIKRRSVRKRAIRKLLEQYGINTQVIDETKYHGLEKSPWDLRTDAMKRPLSDSEFARVLFHIAKRRGADYSYNSRKEASNDKDATKTQKAATELEEKMARSGFQTIGSYLSSCLKKRNGDGSYDNFVMRDLLKSEVRTLFETQRRLGNLKASKALEESYAGTGLAVDERTPRGEGIAFFQRSLQSSEGMVGYCTLEPEEKRAPKQAYTAELFVMWTKLNNARIKTQGGGEVPLSPDQKNKLVDLAHKNQSVTYKQARKELDLSDSERFNISYRSIRDKNNTPDNSWESIREASEKAIFLQLSGYQQLKKALHTGSDVDWQKWLSSDRDKLDEIAHILTYAPDIRATRRELKDIGFDETTIHALENISFSKNLDLSLKAIRNILPHMQAGLLYDKACEQAGYHHSQKQNHGLGKVPPFQDVRNPVVNRALAQARKVVNACFEKYGMPETIIIELARDVGIPFKERQKIEKEQLKNQNVRSETKKEISELYGIIEDNVTGEDILKHRLWKEQQGYCPYSGVYISPEELTNPTATQIDHIIPYSRSWNDSYMNKILCLTSENQNKRNDTPREYFARTGRDITMLEVIANKLPRKKAENLLVENFDETKGKDWKDRALNDTRYMAKLLKNHLEQSLALGDGNRVQTRNGQLTAHLRHAWGFPLKTRSNDRHHALDAIVLACSTQGMVQAVSNWNKYEARLKQMPEERYPPKPWETFREDTLAAVNTIFVSRMPVRKITGQAHQETIRSIRQQPDGTQRIIQRVKLSGLTPAILENMVDKDRNIKLYTVLKERLDQFDGKPDKAFAEPIFMPTNDPEKQAPQIHGIRYVTNEKSGIIINEGLASNGDMVRVDVFQKSGKFFLVPIYVHHFAGERLPNKAIIAAKPEENWEEMREEDFIFSLHKNDLVYIKESETEKYYGYYIRTDRANGGISIKAHDNDSSFGENGVKRKGIKTLLEFEKYSVDYFGNKTRILKETRLGLAHGDDSEFSEGDPF